MQLILSHHYKRKLFIFWQYLNLSYYVALFNAILSPNIGGILRATIWIVLISDRQLKPIFGD